MQRCRAKQFLFISYIIFWFKCEKYSLRRSYLTLAETTPEIAGQCLIHFKCEGKGALTRFTETSFKKVLASHELWLTLCLIHFKGDGKGALTRFTKTSFKQVLASHELWLTLDGEQQEIATKSSSILKNIQSTEESSPMIQGLYHHRNCYAKFTNVTYIKRAQARCSKRQADGNDEDVTAQKTLRSSTAKTTSVRSRICKFYHLFV